MEEEGKEKKDNLKTRKRKERWMRRAMIKRTDGVKSWRRKIGREEEYCRRKRRERAGTGGIRERK